MRVLFLDPGAVRMGWAVLEGKPGKAPVWIASGISGLTRGDTEKYQPYRLRLVEYWTLEGEFLLDSYIPDAVANELLPPATGRAFKSNGVQSQLAATAITAFHTLAYLRNLTITQFGATTIKKDITGNATATKVAVRNGVYTFIPGLKDVRHHLWTKSENQDESDACAGGLVALGYKV